MKSDVQVAEVRSLAEECGWPRITTAREDSIVNRSRKLVLFLIVILGLSVVVATIVTLSRGTAQTAYVVKTWISLGAVIGILIFVQNLLGKAAVKAEDRASVEGRDEWLAWLSQETILPPVLEQVRESLRLKYWPRMRQFYENTMAAWAAERLSWMNENLAAEARSSYEEFRNTYDPILKAFFLGCTPTDAEFLVAAVVYEDNSPIFYLTSERLLQTTKGSAQFKEVHLSKVASVQTTQESFSASLHFEVEDGATFSIEGAKQVPREDILKGLVERFGNVSED